ncbi:MAG: hypothetical protein LM567_07795 [Desulfurococcaceae archaeon]|nr:hypothetical protein [Desulfurococcaceae archaeon]
MKYNLYLIMLVLTMVILTMLGYMFVKLETFVNSTLLISKLIIRTSHIPLLIEGGSWFSHADTLKNYPGSMLLLSIYSLTTGLTPLQVIDLPILLPATVIFTYMLSKIATPSKLLFSLTYLGFIFFYIVNTLNLYTISYHALGYIYYLIYIYLIFSFTIQKKINMQNFILIVIISAMSTLTYYFTSTLIITTSLIIAVLYIPLHRETHQRSSKIFYSALLLSLIIGVIGEIVFSRIVSGIELNLTRLEDLLPGIFQLGSMRVREFETVVFINDLAKTVYINARTLLLDRLTAFYIYYINGLIILLSIAMILGIFSKTSKYSEKSSSLLILYVALFMGSVLHALYYFVTYGALGTRAYIYFVLPFSPIVFMYLIKETLIFLKRNSILIRRLLISIYIFFLLSSFIASIHFDVIAGFIGGYTRSASIERIKTQPEAILLSNILDSSISVITDYQRSQYVFRGFILYEKVGNVKPYLGKLKVLINVSYSATSLESIETIYNNIGTDALLIASDNFNKLVYGDIAAYIAPPFDYAFMNELIRLSNKVYSSTRLTLIRNPTVKP